MCDWKDRRESYQKIVFLKKTDNEAVLLDSHSLFQTPETGTIPPCVTRTDSSYHP